ncbi:MAG: DUF4164 domain-containing protein [Pseudomonadota bacterium]
MTDRNPLAPAMDRLSKAVTSLEKAVEIRMDRESVLSDAEAEVQRMGADRTRLADALDNAEERAQQLEHVNKEVSRRLVDSMEAIKNVIERQK